MEAKIRLEEIDHIEATISITMSIGDWKRLTGQVTGDYPSSRFGIYIKDLVNKMTKQIETETPIVHSH